MFISPMTNHLKHYCWLSGEGQATKFKYFQGSKQYFLQKFLSTSSEKCSANLPGKCCELERV